MMSDDASMDDQTDRGEGSEERWGEEDGYFGSYSHFKIHEEMLKVSECSEASNRGPSEKKTR